MPASKGIDILMKFEPIEGGLIAAESTDALGFSGWDSDPLLYGFLPGFTFEVFNFNFGAGVEIPGIASNDSKQRRAIAALGKSGAIAPHLREHFAEMMRQSSRTASGSGEEQRKWSFSDTQKLPVEMQSVTFSRTIDKASSNLLLRCFNSLYFNSATLAKRRSTGGGLAGYTYLRLDFGGVMLTKIDWSNDDEVQENITFVARSVQIQYRPVLPSGELGDVISGYYKTPSRAAEPE